MMLIRHKGTYFLMLFYLTLTLTENQRLTCLFLKECFNPPALSPLTQQEPCSSWLNEKIERNNNWWTMCISDVLFYQIQTAESATRNAILSSTPPLNKLQNSCNTVGWHGDERCKHLMITVPVSRINSWTFGLELKGFHRAGHIISIGEFSSVNSRNVMQRWVNYSASWKSSKVHQCALWKCGSSSKNSKQVCSSREKLKPIR